MAVIGKIISGGQTGADRGALEAALKRSMGSDPNAANLRLI